MDLKIRQLINHQVIPVFIFQCSVVSYGLAYLPKFLQIGRHRVPFRLILPDATAAIRSTLTCVRLTPAEAPASVVCDGPSTWKVKREAGASVLKLRTLNAGAAPATVSDEPSPVPLGISREGG